MNKESDPVLQSKLETFFLAALQEIYWSEQHLVNVLQTMTDAASDTDLKKLFLDHREETLNHAERLKRVFELMAQEPLTKFSKGLQGLFDEGWHVIDETDPGSSQRDVALIIAAQKVEHYEIACYGSLITLAKTLKRDDVAQILVPTLEEEKHTDLKLTTIAESGINEDASQESTESSTQAVATEEVATETEADASSDEGTSRAPGTTKELIM